MSLSTVLRRTVAASITDACGGSLNRAKPCRGEVTVIQTHRVKIVPMQSGTDDTVDVDIRLCATHSKRLKVGSVVRGVKIVAERSL